VWWVNTSKQRSAWGEMKLQGIMEPSWRASHRGTLTQRHKNKMEPEVMARPVTRAVPRCSPSAFKLPAVVAVSQLVVTTQDNNTEMALGVQIDTARRDQAPIYSLSLTHTSRTRIRTRLHSLDSLVPGHTRPHSHSLSLASARRLDALARDSALRH
jgi:hypothetical protein